MSDQANEMRMSCCVCGCQCDMEEEKILGYDTFCSDECVDEYLKKCEERTGVSVRGVKMSTSREEMEVLGNKIDDLEGLCRDLKREVEELRREIRELNEQKEASK